MNPSTRAYIKRHEGCSLTPYTCTADRITIGYGHNLSDCGISHAIAEALFEEDFAIAVQAASLFWPAGRTAHPNRFAALVDMAYNLGAARLSGFTNLRAALEREDFPAAAGHLLHSRYAKQVPARAQHNATILQTDLPPDTYL
jgi:lysozyme